jgi:transcriptional regulator with XRE-family HTH domain
MPKKCIMLHCMNVGAEPLARAIGARVKQERKNREWTLDQLAAAAGVSRRMLVNVEQGEANPSVGTLLRLSDALGVGLPSLVEPPASPAVRLTRQGEGAVLWTGELGGRGVLVAGTEPPDVVELWEWTLAPGEGHSSEAHSIGTRELLQVQEGVLTIDVDGRLHELGIGDALTFQGDVAHSYLNQNDILTRFSLTVFEPGVGAAHRTETP